MAAVPSVVAKRAKNESEAGNLLACVLVYLPALLNDCEL